MPDKDTSVKKKLPYPKSVFFIVSNEFCERFAYYGTRTILSLYLRDKLSYTDDSSTVIYHVFSMLVYFFPLFGAILADSLLGKFRTIFYLSIVYAAGQLLLAATAVPTFGIPMREFSLIGLLLIAIGTGGIKPCVAAFGGDQFVLPQQERYLIMFFSIFYFAINSGSLISTFVTPELRDDIHCFGEKDCYSLAFLVPAILMTTSIVIFVLGKPMYKIKKPQGNVVLNVVKCISHAIYNKSAKNGHRDHWLDHADDKYDKQIIDDIKAALQVLKLFIPLPIFWALFDQQGSRWTFQATRMDGQIGSYILKADQMQFVNPLFIVIFIPIFETCIYPLLTKTKLIDTPLKKLTTGGLLAAVAFIVSAIVELQLQNTYPVLPSEGLGQVRIFNPQNCFISGELDNGIINIGPYEMWAKKDFEVTNAKQLNYSIKFENCDGSKDNFSQSGVIDVKGNQAISYALLYDSNAPYGWIDAVNKTIKGSPAARLLVHNENYNGGNPMNVVLKEHKSKTEYVINAMINSTRMEELTPTNYDIIVNGKTIKSFDFKLGGVYTILVHQKAGNVQVQPIIVTEPNSVHILWLIPQYIIITMGEVMFSVTGLEFAFTQAPPSMKSLLQGCWLLTVAFGNLLVVIITETKVFDKQSSEFFLFAGLMILDMMIFALMAKFYKYVEVPETDSTEGEFPLEENGGNINPTFATHDEKL